MLAGLPSRALLAASRIARSASPHSFDSAQASKTFWHLALRLSKLMAVSAGAAPVAAPGGAAAGIPPAPAAAPPAPGPKSKAKAAPKTKAKAKPRAKIDIDYKIEKAKAAINEAKKAMKQGKTQKLLEERRKKRIRAKAMSLSEEDVARVLVLKRVGLSPGVDPSIIDTHASQIYDYVRRTLGMSSSSSASSTPGAVEALSLPGAEAETPTALEEPEEEEEEVMEPVTEEPSGPRPEH